MILGDDVTRTSEDVSCENRCFNPTTDPSLCECTPDCISNNTCCQDFLQVCALVTTEGLLIELFVQFILQRRQFYNASLQFRAN